MTLENETAIKIEELAAAGNRRMSNIQDGSKIPASDNGSYHIADLNQFEDFFTLVQKESESRLKNSAWKAYVKQVAPDFDAELFIHLYTFDEALQKKYPDRALSDNPFSRRMQYGLSLFGNPPTLSKLVADGSCYCLEHSVLAQAYCQRQGFDTEILSGSFTKSYQKDKENQSEKHSWISLKTKNGNYMYDPSNPHRTKNGGMPRISSVELSPEQQAAFEDKVSKLSENESVYMLTKSIYNDNRDCYGFTTIDRGTSPIHPQDVCNLQKDKEVNPLIAKLKNGGNSM